MCCLCGGDMIELLFSNTRRRLFFWRECNTGRGAGAGAVVGRPIRACSRSSRSTTDGPLVCLFLGIVVVKRGNCFIGKGLLLTCILVRPTLGDCFLFFLDLRPCCVVMGRVVVLFHGGDCSCTESKKLVLVCSSSSAVSACSAFSVGWRK